MGSVQAYGVGADVFTQRAQLGLHHYQRQRGGWGGGLGGQRSKGTALASLSAVCRHAHFGEEPQAAF